MGCSYHYCSWLFCWDGHYRWILQSFSWI